MSQETQEPTAMDTDDDVGSKVDVRFLGFVKSDKMVKEFWKEGNPPTDEDVLRRVAALLESVYSKQKNRWTTNTTNETKTAVLGVGLEGEVKVALIIEGFPAVLSEENLHSLAKALVAWIEGGRERLPDEREFVSIAHNITEGSLTHTFDLVKFTERVDKVFHLFYPKNGSDTEYIAPYFVLVQSSGMGKTKLLFEYKQSLEVERLALEEKKRAPAEEQQEEQRALAEEGKKQGKKSRGRRKQGKGSQRRKKQRKESVEITAPSEVTVAKLVLCRKMSEDETIKAKELKVFDHFVPFQDLVQERDTFDQAYDRIAPMLTKALLKGTEDLDRVVLLFDEAHYLLKDRQLPGGGSPVEAFLFRIVRLWISIRRTTKLVAVFTGTTAKLSLYRIKDDLKKESPTDSRELRNDPTRSFYHRGSKTFEPFYTLTTIGCLRTRPPPDEPATEYEQAVPFGRPLFADMTTAELSQGLVMIASRMVGETASWEKMESAWISILGTRVQMGQTSISMATDLVAHSYANLVGVSDESAFICFMPDPVCARLAMCLMDEKWEMPLGVGERPLKGRSKSWWMEKVQQLYSKGLCSPEKGDFGEVMVALYFLFCADVLRSRKNPDYTDFSVSLKEWISIVVNGGNESVDGDVEVCQGMTLGNSHSTTLEGGDKQEEEKEGDGEKYLSFGAIQVCRNFVRAYNYSWELLFEEGFLEHLYKAGTGCYVFPGCETIDLFFPLKLTEGGTTSYIPMFVSVKCRSSYTPSEAAKQCEIMKEKAKSARDLKLNIKGNEKETTMMETEEKPSAEDEAQKTSDNDDDELSESGDGMDKDDEPYSESDDQEEAVRPSAEDEEEAVRTATSSGGALCILVVLGSTVKSKDGEKKLSPSCVDEVKEGKIVGKVLRVPVDDTFAVTKTLMELTLPRQSSEVLASHTFIGAHGKQHYLPEVEQNKKNSKFLRRVAHDSEVRMVNTLLLQLSVEELKRKPRSKAATMSENNCG